MKRSGDRSLQISSRPRAVCEGKNWEAKIVRMIRFDTTLFRKVIRFDTLCFAKFFPTASPTQAGNLLLSFHQLTAPVMEIL